MGGARISRRRVEEDNLFFWWVVPKEISYRVWRLLLVAVLLLYLIAVTLVRSMTDGKKSTKRKLHLQTVTARSAISANWQALISSNMLSIDSEKKLEAKPADRFTGKFRRARKKSKLNDVPDMSSLDIKPKEDQTEKESRLPNGEILTEQQKDKAAKLTKVVAMDCEMVGIGPDGEDHMIARVSIVNRFGDCIYDKFVKAREEVVDYRTKVSGIRKEDMLNGEDFAIVQKEVSDILKGRILVGHSLKNDFEVLFLSHPKRSVRDTSKYKPFRKITRGNTPSLKRLASELLGADIQSGEHSSVEDARAAMLLYSRVAKEWERSLAGKRKYDPPK